MAFFIHCVNCKYIFGFRRFSWYRWGKGSKNDFLFCELNSHNLWLTSVNCRESQLVVNCVRNHFVKLFLIVTLPDRRCAPTLPVGSWGTASLFSWTREVSWNPPYPLPSRATRWTSRGRRGPRSHGRKCLEKDHGRRRQTWRKVSYRSGHLLNSIVNFSYWRIIVSSSSHFMFYKLCSIRNARLNTINSKR